MRALPPIPFRVQAEDQHQSAVELVCLLPWQLRLRFRGWSCKEPRQYENKDSPITDERRTIRNVKFVAVARKLWSKPAHYSLGKKGKGVYRRWWHLMPPRRCKSVPALRRQLRRCESQIVLKGTTPPRQIKQIRRVADTVYSGFLYASSRTCDRAECAACTPPESQPADYLKLRDQLLYDMHRDPAYAALCFRYRLHSWWPRRRWSSTCRRRFWW